VALCFQGECQLILFFIPYVLFVIDFNLIMLCYLVLFCYTGGIVL
jgi:hypothetical protein